MRVVVALLASLLLVSSARAEAGPALSVDAGADRHAISADVYGMNGAGAGLADELALPVDRWGGNLFERYNFTLGAVNTANDYFFENIADCFYFETGCDGGNTPYYQGFVKRDVDRGTRPLMQLPMAGYVAKDAPTEHPFTCGFPKAAEPAQEAFDPYDANCGNGRSGGADVPSDPTRAGVAITGADREAWIKDLAGRGVHLYELGNEPNLWNTTHHDIHPQPTTYDELWAKSRDLATAVKDDDPAAAGRRLLGVGLAELLLLRRRQHGHGVLRGATRTAPRRRQRPARELVAAAVQGAVGQPTGDGCSTTSTSTTTRRAGTARTGWTSAARCGTRPTRTPARSTRRSG